MGHDTLVCQKVTLDGQRFQEQWDRLIDKALKGRFYCFKEMRPTGTRITF